MWVDEILYMFFIETKVQENLSSGKENIFSFQLAQIRGHLYFWQNKKSPAWHQQERNSTGNFFGWVLWKPFCIIFLALAQKIEKAYGKCPSQNHLRAHFLKSISLPKKLLQSK